MARITELVKATARATGVAEQTVLVCARWLREAGLIRQFGRGRNSAAMGPADAANLLMALMTSDTLAAAPENVRAIRARRWIGSEIDHDGFVNDEAPPFPFMHHPEGRVCDFGEAMEALVAETIAEGWVCGADEFPLQNLHVDVVQPDNTAEITFHGNHQTYVMKFGDHTEWHHRYLQMSDEEKMAETERRMSHMVTQRTISLHSISNVADCLRGLPLPEHDPEMDHE